MTHLNIPSNVADDSPLRLAIAAAIAYPDGSMTVAGLRKEAERENLVVEFVNGKQYTTLAAIREMRRLCQGKKKGRASGSSQHNPAAGKQSGSSKTVSAELALAAALMTVAALKKPSRSTSPKSTSQKSKA